MEPACEWRSRSAISPDRRTNRGTLRCRRKKGTAFGFLPSPLAFSTRQKKNTSKRNKTKTTHLSLSCSPLAVASSAKQSYKNNARKLPGNTVPAFPKRCSPSLTQLWGKRKENNERGNIGRTWEAYIERLFKIACKRQKIKKGQRLCLEAGCACASYNHREFNNMRAEAIARQVRDVTFGRSLQCALYVLVLRLYN